ncbi:MAG: MFS transporter [Euryarchaeota archaeon]|nr:MFS transporter [Euryarchaeota archaeon]
MRPGSRLLAAVGMYHLANDGSLTVLPLLLPVIRAFVPMTYTQIGILTATGLIATLLMQLAVCQFAHRFSAAKALTLGMAVLALFSVMMAFVTSYASLLVFVIGMRLGAAAYHPLGVALVAHRFSGERIDMAMGVQSSAGDIGVFMAFVTTGLLGALLGWQSAFVLWGAICLAAALTGLGLGIASEERPRVGLGSEPSWSWTFRRVAPLIVPLTIGGAGYNIIVNYAPLMFGDAYGLGIGEYTAIIAMWVGVGAVFTLVFGRISTRFGRGRAIVTSYLLIIAAGFLVWFLTPLWAAVVAMLMLGAGLFMTYPALFSYVTELTGGKRSEKAFGIVFTAQLTGGFILSYVCGVVSDIYGIKTPFLILGIIALAALCFASYYLARLRPRPSP